MVVMATIDRQASLLLGIAKRKINVLSLDKLRWLLAPKVCTRCTAYRIDS